ncbi:YbjN domain-containing protein [Cyanobium sp. FGCU-52]|nr:YbjN domain-containing protein [Cyanobium sp. FGCU52]
MSPRRATGRPLPAFLAGLLARFSDEQRSPQPLGFYVALVDAVLEGLGIDGERQDSDEGWDWTLQVGSAPIDIGLHHNDLLDEDTLEVKATILRLPPQRLLAFYRRCLELNRLLIGCAIGVEGDTVIVASERSLPGLDRAAIARMLIDVASAADQLDDDLAQEFGAAKLGEDLLEP